MTRSALTAVESIYVQDRFVGLTGPGVSRSWWLVIRLGEKSGLAGPSSSTRVDQKEHPDFRDKNDNIEMRGNEMGTTQKAIEYTLLRPYTYTTKLKPKKQSQSQLYRSPYLQPQPQVQSEL